MSGLSRIVFTSLVVMVSAWPLRVAAQGVHAVVDTDKGCLIGGIAGGKWIEAEEFAPLLKGGERYRLYTMTRFVGEATGSDTRAVEDPCNGTKNIKLTPQVNKAIAVGGQWNALPRVPQLLGTNNQIYRRVVAGFLRRHGFVRPKINITQILRVDLEGDGAEEVIVSANYLAGGLSVDGGQMAVRAEPGDYSLVFLRKLIRGKVRDVVLTEGYYPRKSSPYWLPTQDSVLAVLDLNGDGVMEIILDGGYYEGSWSTVFRLDGDQVENVFGCGCGA